MSPLVGLALLLPVLPAGAPAGKFVAPIGVDAIEIGFEQARTLLVLRAAFAQQRQ